MLRKSRLQEIEASLFDGNYSLDENSSPKEELELSFKNDPALWSVINSPQSKKFFNSPFILFANDEKTKGSALTQTKNQVKQKEKAQPSTNQAGTNEPHHYNLRHAPNKYIPR